MLLHHRLWAQDRQPGAKPSASTSGVTSAKREGLTHRGDIGQLIFGLLGVEQVCLALLYGGSPQSSNNGNMAREKDVTLSAIATISTQCVPRARRSARDILGVTGFSPHSNPVWGEGTVCPPHGRADWGTGRSHGFAQGGKIRIKSC